MRAKDNLGRASEAGFSLVELMVVVSIIGLLSTVVAVSVLKYRGQAQTTKVRADIDGFKKAITVFHLNTERYPSALEELIMNPGIEGWDGPYIQGGQKALVDPWKRPYIYQPTGGPNDGEPYVIGSYGQDGAPGGNGANADVFSNQ